MVCDNMSHSGQSEHDDRSNYIHLPLHVQLQSENDSAENSSVEIAKCHQSDQTNNSSDKDSEGTNPHLRSHLNQHFPRDLDFQECCDADGESSLSDSRRHALSRRKKVRRRRKNDATQSVENDSIPEGCPQDEVNPSVLMGEHRLISQVSGLTTDGETKLVSGGSSVQTPLSRLNQWDSSPSTICDEDHNTSLSFDDFFNPLDQDKEEEHESSSSSGIRKNLFSDDDDEFILRTPEAHRYNDIAVEDNSDLELTQLSRQIQLELRLQEMSELAREAERAAEEGVERFVGNATKFELGLGLDVGDAGDSSDDEFPNQKVDRDSWKLFGNIDCNRLDYDAVTPLRGSKSVRSISQTEIKKLKRPSIISSKDRQSSAPTNAAARRGMGRHSLHSMPSILSSGTFLSVVATTNAQEKKIPVLALRHIDEVIPTFKEMHPFMKSNMKRCHVNEDILNFQLNNDGRDDSLTTDEKDTRRGSMFPSRNGSSTPSVSVPFFPRVPSFNVIMKSMSGMSAAEPGKVVQTYKSDDEISYRPEDVDGDKDADISLAPDDMTLDCVSFVSCGDMSHGKAVLDTPEKKMVLSLSDDDEISVESDSSNNAFACTLATEVHDPSHVRPIPSPLPKAPFDDDDGDLDIIAPKFLRTPTSSRWPTLSNFWDNISPAKRNISLPSPLRLQLPSSLESRRNTWAFADGSLPSKANSMVMNRSNAFVAIQFASMRDERIRDERTFYPKRDGPRFEDEPWELQKDDASDGITISSESFSQTIPRSHSPFEWYNGSGRNVNKIDPCDEGIGNESLTENPTSIENINDNINTEGKKMADEVDLIFSRKEFCKGSFRTSTTHMSGDDSQSSYSKLSQLMVRPLEDNASNQSSQPSPLLNIESANTSDSKEGEIFDKPPLHPITARSKIHLSQSSHIEEVHILPTIKASISCPDVSDASSALNMASESESGHENESLQETIKMSCKIMTHSPDKADVCMYEHWRHDDEVNVRVPGRKKLSAPPSSELMEEANSVVSTEEDEKNKSMTFKNLIEKVPSVIGRFRPFRRAKQEKPEHKDDTEFVKNYFFTGVKSKLDKNPKEKKSRTQANLKFGADLCTDFNCGSVFESAWTSCLSTETSKVHVNQYDSTYSNDQVFSYPHARIQKYGNLNTFGKNEQVVAGDRIFKAPYLKALKGKAIEGDLNQSFDSGSPLEMPIHELT